MCSHNALPFMSLHESLDYQGTVGTLMVWSRLEGKSWQIQYSQRQTNRTYEMVFKFLPLSSWMYSCSQKFLGINPNQSSSECLPGSLESNDQELNSPQFQWGWVLSTTSFCFIDVWSSQHWLPVVELFNLTVRSSRQMWLWLDFPDENKW